MKARALRRHDTKRVIKNRVRVAKAIGWDKVIQQPHRLAKRHPCDCGNPKCMCCHSEKLLGHIKISDKRKLQKEKE